MKQADLPSHCALCSAAGTTCTPDAASQPPAAALHPARASWRRETQRLQQVMNCCCMGSKHGCLADSPRRTQGCADQPSPSCTACLPTSPPTGNCAITGKPSDAGGLQRYIPVRCPTCSEEQAVYFLRVEQQDAGCCASPAFLATWPPVARREGLAGNLKAWGCTFDPSWAAFNSLLCGASNETFSQLVAAASGAGNTCPAGVAAALNKVRNRWPPWHACFGPARWVGFASHLHAPGSSRSSTCHTSSYLLPVPVAGHTGMPCCSR